MPNTNLGAACPELEVYEKLAVGTLPDADKQALLLHLERCDRCARRLQRQPEADTLAALLRDADTVEAERLADRIAPLLDDLKKLRPQAEATAATPSRAEAQRAEPLVMFGSEVHVRVQGLDRAMGAGHIGGVETGRVLIGADHEPHPSDARQSARRRGTDPFRGAGHRD